MGVRAISRRPAKDGKSLTSQWSHPKRNAPALCPAAGSVATPASRVVSTRFAPADQTPSAAHRAANPDSIGIPHLTRGETRAGQSRPSPLTPLPGGEGDKSRWNRELALHAFVP